MKSVFILLVLTYVYHDAQFRQRKITATRCVITQKSAILEGKLFDVFIQFCSHSK
jgi:hypothetical protein